MAERTLGEISFVEIADALGDKRKRLEVKFDRGDGEKPDWYAVQSIRGFQPPNTVVCKLSFSPLGFNGVSLTTPARIRSLNDPVVRDVVKSRYLPGGERVEHAD